MSAALQVVLALPAPPTKFDDLFALVLDSIENAGTRRHYQRALGAFLLWTAEQGYSFNRAGVQAFRAELSQQGLAPPSINLQLSAIRKLAQEAANVGLLDPHTAAGVIAVRNIRQQGSLAGNWLILPQAQALILAPDPTTGKGVRDRAILALLLGCGLRRMEAAHLTFDKIQRRDGRWAIVDLRGKRNRIRTVAMPAWVKEAIDHWAAAARISTGPVLRAMDAQSRLLHENPMSGQAILDVARLYGRKIGVDLKAHDLRRTCAKLSRRGGAALEQIQIMLGHSSVQTTERYLGTKQDLERAPNDGIDLGWRKG
jgi:site-specific recombinase XerD